MNQLQKVLIPTEVPVTGKVDNRSTDALVDAVFTNGDQVLALEYGNAGREYSNANVSIVGTGYGLTVNCNLQHRWNLQN